MAENSEFLQFLDAFLNDAREGFQECDEALLALEDDPANANELDHLFRNIHTLKSASAMLEFHEIRELAHHTEDTLGRLRDGQGQVSHTMATVLFDILDTLKAMVEARAKMRGMHTGDWIDWSTALLDRLDAAEHEQQDMQPVPEKGEKQSSSSSLPKIDKIETIRVRVGLLDSLFNLVGELLIAKRQVDTLLPDADKALKKTLANMARLINDIQEDVSEARLVRADEVLRRFPRLVRDMAQAQEKNVSLVMSGQELELDKAVLDAIGEPLIHLLRNAVDHGMESVDQRNQQGKPEQSTIQLAVRRLENSIEITVEDDGAGIDIGRLREAFIEKGLLDADKAKDYGEEEILELIFSPGFTGVSSVTDFSGRGVGLDVVKTTAERLGGMAFVETTDGQGSRFGMRLPQSTALIQTLMVGAGSYQFAIPSDIVHETLQITQRAIREMGDQQVILFRKKMVPFYMLSELLDLPRQSASEELIAVILSYGDKLVSFGVDSLEYLSATIVKPFDPLARDFKGFAGGTVLGDGSVVLLLDIPGLMRQATAAVTELAYAG